MGEKNNSIHFGDEPNTDKLFKIASEIKTFTEVTDPHSSEIFSLREKMSEAKKLAFIGFEFHKINMELISPNRVSAGTGMQVFATVYGISESSQEELRDKISIQYGKEVNNLHNRKVRLPMLTGNDTQPELFPSDTGMKLFLPRSGFVL